MDVTKFDVYRNAPLNTRGRRVFRRTLRVGMRQMKREILAALIPFRGKSLKEVSPNEIREAMIKHLEREDVLVKFDRIPTP